MHLSKKRTLGFFLLTIVIGIVGCDGWYQNKTTPEWVEIPPGFPDFDIPEDNPLTREKVALGKMLFFDVNLSKDRTISCASCHLPELAFSDSSALSVGSHSKLGFRNAPTLTNVAYLDKFFHDGGIPTLERQVMAPFNDSLEFNLPLKEALNRITSQEHYVAFFQKVFGSEPTLFGLTRAIAAYERTLISGNSRYDQEFFQNKKVYTDTEMRGYKLFVSDSLNCVKCHSGFNFTNQSFQNNGMKVSYADSGRARITMQTMDNGKFKVPTLRNIGLTAPYMHDGSYATLDDVIAQYAQGGSGHINQSSLIRGFYLSDDDKEALKAFLNSLTDTTFIGKH